MKQLVEERKGRNCTLLSWTWIRRMVKFADKHCWECCMNVELISLYDGGRACLRLGSRVGEHFEVRRGLRQWYIMSP